MIAAKDSATSLAEQIGRRIRDTRLQRLISQAELAQALGIERSTLTKYELGQRSISAEMLVQVARTLQVAPAVLLDEGAGVTSTALEQVMRVLTRRPDMVPQVLDLLEVVLGAEGDQVDSEASAEQS